MPALLCSCINCPGDENKTAFPLSLGKAGCSFTGLLSDVGLQVERKTPTHLLALCLVPRFLPPTAGASIRSGAAPKLVATVATHG